MGLDMYLKKEVFVGANYDHRKVTGIVDIKIDNEPIEIDFNKISSISLHIACWRKANQVHNWFVKNIQEGIDDCKSYYVSGEKLKELVNICQEVLKDPNKAEILLPNRKGFFFGSTAHDEYYFKDLENTIKQLKSIDVDDCYEYCASW